MKVLNVGHYKNDDRSRFVYLGAAKAKAVHLQPTEQPGLKLLDVVFEVPIEGENPCEFMLRLETSIEEIDRLIDYLIHATENPRPHPYMHDLFQKAVTGRTPFEEHQSLIRRLNENEEGDIRDS